MIVGKKEMLFYPATISGSSHVIWLRSCHSERFKP